MAVNVSDIVHYVRAERPNRGCCRPAIVCQTPGTDSDGRPLVNVHVFADGANDMPALRGRDTEQLVGSQYKRRVRHDPEGRPGTWHWAWECESEHAAGATDHG